jgi:DNA-binding response OmpR family regulator
MKVTIVPRPSRILIIDDEDQVRFCIKAYLEDSGFVCMEAGDGIEGMEAFRSFRPDLVLTDLRMPRLDGFNFITTLRDLSPATPVVVLTGTYDLYAAEAAKGLGARYCLFKPLLDMQVLLVTIQACLASSDPQGDES